MRIQAKEHKRCHQELGVRPGPTLRASGGTQPVPPRPQTSNLQSPERGFRSPGFGHFVPTALRCSCREDQGDDTGVCGQSAFNATSSSALQPFTNQKVRLGSCKVIPEFSAPDHPLSKKKETALFLPEILTDFVLSRGDTLPNSPKMSTKQDKHPTVFRVRVGGTLWK